MSFKARMPLGMRRPERPQPRAFNLSEWTSKPTYEEDVEFLKKVEESKRRDVAPVASEPDDQTIDDIEAEPVIGGDSLEPAPEKKVSLSDKIDGLTEEVRGIKQSSKGLSGPDTSGGKQVNYTIVRDSDGRIESVNAFEY